MEVEFVREINDPGRASQCLVRKGDAYFVVSSCDVPFSGPETLVFKSDAEGDITEWGEVAGGKRMSREEAIADLEASNGT